MSALGVTLNAWQESVVADLYKFPVTVISAPRGAGETTLGLEAAYREADRSGLAVFTSAALGQFQWVSQSASLRGGALKIGENKYIRFCREDNIRLIKGMDSKLIVIDAANWYNGETTAEIIGAHQRSHILILGHLPAKASYRSSYGDLWFKQAFEGAYNLGWNAKHFSFETLHDLYGFDLAVIPEHILTGASHS